MNATETRSTALEVVDPNGEILDLREQSDERLAVLLDDIAAARERFADVETAASDELVRRLDRNASWTLRVGDPAVGQWEIKTSSPTAGTTAYDERLLEAELRKLVERETISPAGAAGALERTLAIVVAVPLDADLDDLAKLIRTAPEIRLADVVVEPRKVEPNRKAKQGGIDKLRKVDGTGAALDRAQLKVPAPKRRAKVSRVKRADD